MNTAVIVGTSTNIESYSKNIEGCIKSTSNFTETIYTNICTGQISSVKNGTADMAGNVALVIMGIVIVCFFIVLLIKFLKN